MIVNKDKCLGCGRCVQACPCDAITLVNGIPSFDDSKCAMCGQCIDNCLQKAISCKEGE